MIAHGRRSWPCRKANAKPQPNSKSAPCFGRHFSEMRQPPGKAQRPLLSFQRAPTSFMAPHSPWPSPETMSRRKSSRTIWRSAFPRTPRSNTVTFPYCGRASRSTITIPQRLSTPSRPPPPTTWPRRAAASTHFMDPCTRSTCVAKLTSPLITETKPPPSSRRSLTTAVSWSAIPSAH